MKMCWCTVLVKDMEKSLEFYQGALALQVQRRYTTPEGLEIVFLSDGAMSEVELIRNPHLPAYEGWGITLGFEVASLSDTMASFAEQNIEILRGPIETASGIRFFYVQDPNGLEIQLVEATK